MCDEKKIPLPFSAGHTNRLATVLNLLRFLCEIFDIKPGWLSFSTANKSRLTAMLTQDMDYIPINHKPDQKNPYTYHFTDVNTTHHLIERINAGKDLHFLSRTNLLTKLPGREHVLGQLIRRILMRTKLFYSAQMLS
jgi:hypothetical protein